MIDMHVHILPGVDDGAQDIHMTREMLHRAKEAGITRMFATPHVYQPQDQEKNLAPLSTVRQMSHQMKIPLSMGCELNYRALTKTGTTDLGAFCLGPTNCVLLELSPDRLLPGWDTLVSDMQDHGYLPIIAHPERYAYIQRDFGIVKEMCELGCEMQVDVGGLMAQIFSAERRTARKLLKEGFTHYISSDAHRPEDYDVFEKAYQIFEAEWPKKNRLTRALRALQEERKHRG